MADALVTLTTDFGDASPYVAAMKGVVLGVNPSARIIDLAHRLPPQDVRHASYFLAAALPHFPPGVLHVVVVDPGVGTERGLLQVEVAGHCVLAPDNGCLSGFLDAVGGTPRVRRLSEPLYWRRQVSSTFHGRDILAPVAGHLSLGLDPAHLGPVMTNWVRLESPGFTVIPDGVSGEVVFVDDFGNLITSIPASRLSTTATECVLGGMSLGVVRRVRAYAEAGPGELVLLTSSTEHLELAVVNGSAAQRLGGRIGTSVVFRVG
jgi:S-adenosyl-L-methionine hydrolase (adenosine-forming)